MRFPTPHFTFPVCHVLDWNRSESLHYPSHSSGDSNRYFCQFISFSWRILFGGVIIRRLPSSCLEGATDHSPFCLFCIFSNCRLRGNRGQRPYRPVAKRGIRVGFSSLWDLQGCPKKCLPVWVNSTLCLGRVHAP